VEDDVTFDSCDHLRFSLHSDYGDDFEIFSGRSASPSRLRYAG
jgi:hypothetical protein